MDLTFSERTRLKRLIWEGVTRSADRLGKLSRTQWGVLSLNTDEVQVVQLLSWFHGAKEGHVAAILRADRDIPTTAVLIFSEADARVLTETVTRPWAERMLRLPNLVDLTVGEVSNILAQCAIGALADQYQKTIILSTPRVRRGAKAELLAEALERFDGRKDTLMTSDVEMYSNDLAAKCSMVLIYDSVSLHEMLVDAASRV